MNKKVVFYYPWKGEDIGTRYLCGMADILAATGEYDVFFVDYYNGLSDDIITDFRIRKIPYLGPSQKLEVFCGEQIVFIAPLSMAHSVPKLHPDSRILFVDWSAGMAGELQKSWRLPAEGIDRFLSLLADTDSLSFFEQTQWASIREKVEVRERYVPYVVEESRVRAKKELISEDEINVAVMCRMSTKNVYGAKNLAESLSRLRSEKPVNIHVIGEGPEADRFYGSYYGENVHVIRYGDMDIQSAQQLLARSADILFSTGISVLYGASIGLPSCVMPVEENPFRQDTFVRLPNGRDFALEWPAEQSEKLSMKGETVGEILSSVYEDGQKASFGEACLRFCQEHGAGCLELVRGALGQSRLTYKRLCDFIDVERELLPTARRHLHTIGLTWSKMWLRLRNKVRTACGTTAKKYVLFGLPFIILTRRDELIYNLFFLYIPLLRFKRKGSPSKNSYAVQPLLLVWLWKALKKIACRLKGRPEPAVSSAEAPSQSEEHRKLRQRIETKLANGEKIRVCLFEPRISCWKFGNLYRLLEQSDVFEPIIVAVPFPSLGYDTMIEYMDQIYDQLSGEGYRILKGYDKQTGKYLNIKNELDPDVVFYSMYWKNHFQENSYITKFEDIYSFLYPYGFDAVWYADRGGFNYELQLKVHRYYMPTKIHMGLAQDNMDNHGKNVYVTGSPQLDYLLDKSYTPKDVWKPNPGHKKRVIWAPHHSFTNQLPYAKLSAFLDLYDFMLDVAEKYKDSIQFAFKPHPMLKPRLIKLWGAERTEEYYSRWANGENTQYEDGAFIDLFLTSDAMILDSVSFITEYTVIDKPMFFTYGKDTRFPRNRYGRAITKVIYENSSFETLFDEVTEFIDKVVLQGVDPMKEKREAFIRDHLLPEGNKTAAENIYEDMCRVILEDDVREYKIKWD